MTRRGLWKIAASAIVVVFFATMSAHAADEGGNTTERANEFFKWINFAIVAGLIAWVFLKLTAPFFRKNAENISSAITKATVAKAEADRQLREAEEKLARLEQEVAQLRATAQREATGKAEIEAAERAARLELKAMAANLAVDGAESLLVKQLTPQAQESLMAAFMKDLEGRPN